MQNTHLPLVDAYNPTAVCCWQVTVAPFMCGCLVSKWLFSSSPSGDSGRKASIPFYQLAIWINHFFKNDSIELLKLAHLFQSGFFVGKSQHSTFPNKKKVVDGPPLHPGDPKMLETFFLLPLNMVPTTPDLDSTTLGRFIRQLLLVSQQQVVHIAPTYLKKLPERKGGW